MSYTHSYTNKIEIINKIPETASITGTGVLELIWYWPDVLPEHIMKERLTNPLYGREELNRNIQEMAANSSSIEEIWRITEKLPPLSDLLLEEQ